MRNDGPPRAYLEHLRDRQSAGMPIAFCPWPDGDGVLCGYITSVSESELGAQLVSPYGQLEDDGIWRLQHIAYIDSVPSYAERLVRLREYTPTRPEDYTFVADRRGLYIALREVCASGEIVSLRLEGIDQTVFARVVNINAGWAELLEFGELMEERSSSIWRKTAIRGIRRQKAAEEADEFLLARRSDRSLGVGRSAAQIPECALRQWAELGRPIGICLRRNQDSMEWGYLLKVSRGSITVGLLSSLGERHEDREFRIADITYFETDPPYAERLQGLEGFSATLPDVDDFAQGKRAVIAGLNAAVQSGEPVRLRIREGEDYDEKTARVLACDAFWVELAEYDDLMREISRSLYRKSFVQAIQRRTAAQESDEYLLRIMRAPARAGW